MTEHEEYCVSIRESYRIPDYTLEGYTVTLWRWNHLDETWWYAAIRDYLFADYNGNHKKALRQARRDVENSPEYSTAPTMTPTRKECGNERRA